MFQELKPGEFDRARSLFGGFDYSLSIHAAIEGNNPGRIFVDHVRRCAIQVHRYSLVCLGGAPSCDSDFLRCKRKDTGSKRQPADVARESLQPPGRRRFG